MLRILAATAADVPVILEMIRGLAEYEKLSSEVSATEEQLRGTLFGARPAAEVLLAYDGGDCAGFALFFTNYSTFLAKPGFYLEDLYVKPEFRGRGIGKSLLVRLAQMAVEREYGRIDWAVLHWNTPSIEFYKSLGAMHLEDWAPFRITGHALEKLALLKS